MCRKWIAGAECRLGQSHVKIVGIVLGLVAVVFINANLFDIAEHGGNAGPKARQHDSGGENELLARLAVFRNTPGIFTLERKADAQFVTGSELRTRCEHVKVGAVVWLIVFAVHRPPDIFPMIARGEGNLA